MRRMRALWMRAQSISEDVLTVGEDDDDDDDEETEDEVCVLHMQNNY